MKKGSGTRSTSVGSLLAALAAATTLTLVAGCPDFDLPPDNDNAGNVNDNADDNENDNVDDNENDNGAVAARFAGAETCRNCHAGDHADWTATAHAGAFQSLADIGQETNGECLGCHTVGFGEEGGFVDFATTEHLAGVQCENCHGPAAEHAASPGDESKRPTINQSADHCGACHTDAHHPTFDEWELSRHAEALATLQARESAPDTCLSCHSQDYRQAVEDGSDEVPTVATAQLSIECVTCHAPHGGVEQAAQLRSPIGTLCGECHTQGDSVLPDATPHHPQFEMIKGEGAFNADGSELLTPGQHTSLVATDAGAACAQCHVVRHEVEEPNEGNPNVTGHTFNPFDESITEHQADQYTGCAPCHDATGAEQRRLETQTNIESRLIDLATYFDAEDPNYINPDGLPDDAARARLSVARFNYLYVNADGSRGVHNPANAEAALDVAEEIIAELAP